MTEREVIDLLRQRHRPPEWAFLNHVPNGTGERKSRTADAVAMNLWPSRGMELHGFEIKVWRGDWLRELADPAKAEEIAARCHRWWVVAAEDVIAQGDLFPQTWGLMVIRAGALVVEREAPLLAPAPLDWNFLAAILRRAAEAQARPEPAAQRRVRGVDPVTESDAGKLMARLERLRTTADRIGNDIHAAIGDMKRAERQACSESEVA